MVKKSPIDTIQFHGGRLCLDFTNTVHDRLEEPLNDYLHSVNDLIEWSSRSEVVNSGTMKTVKRKALEKTKQADAFLAEAIKFRELIYDMFLCIARKKRIPRTRLDAFNKLVSLYFPHLKIIQSGNDYDEEWDYPSGSL